MSKGIPEGWVEKPLSALAHYHNGRAFKPEDWSSEGLPIIRIAQITNINAEFDYYAGDDVSDKNHIVNGDLLFSWSATLTALIWNRGDAVLNQHIFKVEEKEGIDRKYLHQVILNSIDPLADYSHGSTMKHIKKGVLDEYCVAIPDFPEQKKIAAILSSVDDIIEKTRAQIDKLKDLKTGMMQELLTKGIGHTEFKDSPVGRIPAVWDVCSVSDVARLTSGGTPDRRKDEYWNGTIPWVKTGEVNYKTVYDTEEKITELGLSESSAKLIPVGAILMAMYGQGVTRGKVAKLGISAAVNQACLAMIPNDRILGDFLYYYFSHEYLSLRSMVQEGAQKNLSMSIVKEILLPVPPLGEQEKIVNALQSIDIKIQLMKKRLRGTMKIKKALMQDLLTGKVRVNVD